MAGKGLGMGLEALFGEAAFEEPARGEKTMLPIAKVEPRKDQPRQAFDPDALAELTDSIREHGVIQPLTVRPIEDGYYQIIAGERRWRAARAAGLSEVPVRIVEADDRTAMELALVENLQREDLNPIEEAKGYRVLMQEYGLKQEAVASRIGKSRPVIANALRLLTLPEPVVAMVEAGTLSTSHARAILELEQPEQQLEAAKLAAEKNLTVREITALIKKMGKPAPNRAKSQFGVGADGVDYLAEVERRLTNALQRKVKIVYGQKKGRIEIEYYGEADFEAICNALEQLPEK